MEFRKILTDKVDVAYKIVEDRFRFLKEKNIDQYPFPYPPREEYIKNNDMGKNYGYFDNSDLVGIVTLDINEKQDGWETIYFPQDYLWVSSLYTDLRFSGKNYGYKILDCIQQIAKNNNIANIMLDCYRDGNFLEHFYSKYGFIKVDEKDFVFPGRIFRACLMKFEKPD